MSIFADKKILCIAETPLQIISLVCIFSTPKNRDFGECDVVVTKTFRGSEEMAQRVIEEKIFSEVILIEQYDISYRHVTLDSYFRWVFGGRKLRNRFYKKCGLIGKGQYDILLCASTTRLVLDSKHYSVSKGFTVFFDEGSGSHNGRVFQGVCPDSVLSPTVQMSCGEKIKTTVKRLVGDIFPSTKFNIKQIHLLSVGEREKEIYQGVEIVPIEYRVHINRLNRLFALNNERDKERIIYLSLPGDVSDAMKKSEMHLIKMMDRKLDTKLHLQIHPRRDMGEFDLYQDSILPSNEPWEVLVANGLVDDDSILIGFCSSAQLNPKMLYGVEPTLVFLHKMVEESDLSVAFERSVTQIQSIYTQQEKIIIPRNTAEFEAVLESIVKSTNGAGR